MVLYLNDISEQRIISSHLEFNAEQHFATFEKVEKLAMDFTK